MSSENSVFEEIKKQLTVEDVVTFYSGEVHNRVALCPFHEDTRPSLHVIDKKGIFKCFACGEGGDAITFVSKLKKISPLQAARLINKDFNLGIEIKKTKNEIKYEIEEDRIEAAHKNLSTKAKEYLHQKGLTNKTIDEYEIGSDGNYIIYPIRNSSGRVIGNQKGSFVDKGFELPGPENELFKPGISLGNIDKVRDSVSQRIVITESYRDAMLCFQYGIPAVCLFGINLSKEQVEELLVLTPYLTLALDNDATGYKNSIRHYKLIKSINGEVDVNIADFGEHKDLGDFLLEKQEIITRDIVGYLLEKGINKDYLTRMVCYSPLDMELRVASRHLAKHYGVEACDLFRDLKFKRSNIANYKKKDKPYKWI